MCRAITTRAVAMLLICLTLAAGCSKDKGTNTGDDGSGLVVSPNPVRCGLAASDARESRFPVVLTYNGTDTVNCRAEVHASWAELRETLFTLVPEGSRQFDVVASAEYLKAGDYSDVLTLTLLKTPPHSRQISVLFHVRPETTYVNMYNPLGHVDYGGFVNECQRYNVNTTWVFKCFSNTGKAVDVYRYEASSGSLLVTQSVAITMHSGEFRNESMDFVACGPSPPPIYVTWGVRVYYRYPGDSSWVEVYLNN